MTKNTNQSFVALNRAALVAKVNSDIKQGRFPSPGARRCTNTVVALRAGHITKDESLELLAFAYEGA